MRYAALDGGKRIRPVLAYAAGDALGLKPLAIDRLAASIEVIHAYSLIHDDVPAMDDDDMRRGRPSAHRAFDEATAILAGDALQALAFQIISEDGDLMPEIRLKIVTALARACGSMGMAGGQMLDLKAVGRRLRLPELEHMHALKTGALIELCVTAPGIIANADSQVLEALSTYGASIGLAFQVHDDVLDRIGETQSMGKMAMADAVKDKPTFPSTIGLEASRRRARELRDQAVAALDTCPGDRSTLIHLAHYVITRDR
jgi:farnesyl diphosphate synthase